VAIGRVARVAQTGRSGPACSGPPQLRARELRRALGHRQTAHRQTDAQTDSGTIWPVRARASRPATLVPARFCLLLTTGWALSLGPLGRPFPTPIGFLINRRADKSVRPCPARRPLALISCLFLFPSAAAAPSPRRPFCRRPPLLALSTPLHWSGLGSPTTVCVSSVFGINLASGAVGGGRSGVRGRHSATGRLALGTCASCLAP